MKSIPAGFFKKKLLFFILAVIVFAGSFYIRWYNMSTVPYGIEEDEYAWITTAQFQAKGIDASTKGIWFIHIGNAKNYPLSLWIHQLAFQLFGPDILSARKILAIVSVLSIIALFFFLTFFFNKYLAILLVAAYSFSTYKLISSKIALPSVYQELPMLCAFIFALLVQKYSDWKQYMFAFGAGVCVVFSLLSYNITYMVPFITFGFLMFGLSKHSIGLKRTMLYILSYLLPLLLCLPFFLSVIAREFESKQYMFNLSNTSISYPNIIAHIQNAWNILWNPLTQGTSDMLLAYPYPLIPRLITVGAIIGLVFACISWRKYWPLIYWALLQSVAHHIFFGFNLPRTWFLTAGILYVLTGVTIQTVWNKLRHAWEKRLVVVILLGCLGYLIISGVYIYFSSAIHHVAYRPYIRDVFEISKKYIGTKNAVYIIPESDPFWLTNTWPTVVAFSLSGLQTTDNVNLNLQTRQDMGILSIDEFTAKIQDHMIPPCSTLIAEPALIQSVYTIVQSHCSRQYRIDKYLKYWVAVPANK